LITFERRGQKLCRRSPTYHCFTECDNWDQIELRRLLV